MIVSKFGTKKDIYRFNFHFDDIKITISNLNKKGYRDSKNILIQTNIGNKEQESNLTEFFKSDHGKALGISFENNLQKLFIWWIFENSSIIKLNCPFIDELRDK